MKHMRVWLLTVSVVLAAWAYVIFGSLVAPAPLIVVGLGVWLAIRRHRAALAVLIGVSPIGFSFVWAATSYALGTGRLWTIGYPQVELANVGPTTRLQSVSSGCMVSGGEWMIQLPNNAMLAALTFVFGPMRGTYDGPYPGDAQVDGILSNATLVATSDIAVDRLRIAGREIRLKPGLGKKLSVRGSAELSKAKAAIWKNRVLVLQFQFSNGVDERPFDALLDVESGQIIAYRGAGLDRRLPKQWTE